jgi:hypothetical protein
MARPGLALIPGKRDLTLRGWPRNQESVPINKTERAVDATVKLLKSL